MKKIRSPTEESCFTQYLNANKCLYQSKLPFDNESSFSSLESDIVMHHNVEQYNHQKPTRKYNYLTKNDLAQPLQLDQEIYKNQILNSTQNALSLLQTENKILYEQKIINQKRIQELTIQNQVYRRQLELLRQTNQHIQQDVKSGNQQIRKLRLQINKSNSKFHQTYYQQQKIVDRELLEKLRENERLFCELEIEKAAAQKKLNSQKHKVSSLQKQIATLRQKIRSFQKQLFQINLKQEQLRRSYGDAEQKLIKKIEQLESQIDSKIDNKENSEKWKDNFIHAFLDMIEKVGKKQNFNLKPQYSEKRRTKLGWKFLKQLIFKKYKFDS